MGNVPKIIHYCWFGKGPMNEDIKSCINSWYKYSEGYTIKEWNESNFDISINSYVREAYNNKSWAFVSDYVRMYALYNEGGIYLDTDVELTCCLDEFLKYPLFLGMQSDNEIQTALIGAEEKNSIIKLFLDYYTQKHFVNNKNECDYRTNNSILTQILVENYGLELKNTKQNLHNKVFVFSSEFFTAPKEHLQNYAIHYFDASWIPRELLIKEMRNYKVNYNVCLKWLENNIKGLKFYYKLSQYNNVAIYGLGYIGRMFVRQLKMENINIKCIIDSGTMNEQYDEIPILKPSQTENIDLDLVVITPIFDFENIRNELMLYTKAKLDSFEDLLSEMK